MATLEFNKLEDFIAEVTRMNQFSDRASEKVMAHVQEMDMPFTDEKGEKLLGSMVAFTAKHDFDVLKYSMIVGQAKTEEEAKALFQKRSDAIKAAKSDLENAGIRMARGVWTA